jgi:hypothetical protein
MKPYSNSTILSNQPLGGFIVDNGKYAVVPYCNQLMVIHNGKQLKVCLSEQSARKYIERHRRGGKSQAKLPVD